MRQIDVSYHVQSQVAIATAIATLIAALTDADGVPLEGSSGAACTLVGPAGQTVTGGNMRCLVYVPCAVTRADNTLPVITYRWTKVPALDFVPTTGQRDCPSGDAEAFTGVGRIIWLPDAITLSGGTTVDVVTYSRQGRAVQSI